MCADAYGSSRLILITEDRRLSPMGRYLHDFGSERYQLSMVIYSSFHRNGSTGHYETVGLFPLIDGAPPVADTTEEPATLLEKDHWLLVSLRAAANSRSGSQTLDAQRIDVTRYDGPGSDIVLNTPHSTAMAPSTPETRPRRKTMLPHRYRNAGPDKSVRQPRAARSLRAQLDATLAPGHGNDRPWERIGIAPEVPLSQPSRSSQPAAQPVAAAPRHPQSTRFDAVGARALANLSRWLRENS